MSRIDPPREVSFTERVIHRAKMIGVAHVPAEMSMSMSQDAYEDFITNKIAVRLVAEVFRERVRDEVAHVDWRRDVDVVVSRRTAWVPIAAACWIVGGAGAIAASLFLILVSCALALLAVVVHAYPQETTERVSVAGTVDVPVGVYACFPDYVAPAGMDHVVIPEIGAADVRWWQA